MNGSGLEVGGSLQLVKEGFGSQDEGGLLEGEELLVHPLVYRAHVVVAISIVVSGIAGASSNFSLLVIHFRLKERLLDPSGLLLANFLMANLAMAILQFPFSGSSALAGRSSSSSLFIFSFTFSSSYSLFYSSCSSFLSL